MPVIDATASVTDPLFTTDELVKRMAEPSPTPVPLVPVVDTSPKLLTVAGLTADTPI